MSQWIKATTPPDSDRMVLICPAKHGQVGIGRYARNCDGEGWWVDVIAERGDHGSGLSTIGGVRYWMPLPKAPAGTPKHDDTVYEAIVCAAYP
jgi:hypothetical protein